MSTIDQYVPQVALSRAAVGQVRAGLHAGRFNQAMIVAIFALATVAGFEVTDTHLAGDAATASGPDLVRLLRAMAAIKSVMALAAVSAIVWRLAAPVGTAGLAAYALSCAAMAAGPGLIWDMAHVGLGALLLHGGLACAVLLLWRDPATSTLLSAALLKKTAAPQIE